MPCPAFATILIALAVSVASAGTGRTYYEEASLDSLSSLYGEMLAENLSHVEASGQIPPPLVEYRQLCEKTLLALAETSAGTNIVDVFPVYLSGWIQATNAVPTLLDILEVPRGTNDVGTCCGYYGPIVTTPRPPTPPTPAAGALSIGPVTLDTLTDQLCLAEMGSPRAELLLWVAMAKFGEDFDQIVTNGASGNPPWIWARERGPLFQPPPRPFQFRAFAFRFPKEDMDCYLNIFKILRQTAESAEAAGFDDLFEAATNALLEIGHPYDEDSALWPR